MFCQVEQQVRILLWGEVAYTPHDLQVCVDTEFLSDVAVKVGTVASDYGRDNDYDAIFVLKAQPLVYVRESADLTDTIIKLYDQRFPHDHE